MDRKILDEIKMLDNLLIRKTIDEIKKYEFNLTPIQMSIIGYITNKNEVYQKDIEKFLSVRRSTASEILNTMEKKNIIKREVVDGDLRKKQIILTEDTKDKQQLIINSIKKLESNLTKNISYNDLVAFYSVVDKIKNNIEKS